MKLMSCFLQRFIVCTLLLSASIFHARAQYCTPSFVFGCSWVGFEIDDLNTFTVTGVSSTAISDINTHCGVATGYDNRTFLSVTFAQGGSYSASANSSTSGDNIQVFIDFNDNFTFAAGESVGGMNGIAATPSLSAFTITIPATAATGTHRMRVIVNADGTYPTLNPCGGITYGAGEVHDYTVVITGISTGTCPPVTGLTASAITASSATLNWTAAAGAVGYEWAVTTSATPPASGTATTLTTANPTGLTASTAYYAHVRTNCGATLSTWVTIPFTTLAAAVCPPVTGLTASAITASSATLNWTAAAGAVGYEWAVTTSATPPASGTATTLTTANPTGLAASTAYYAHVRTNCGTSFSSWVTIPFTTLATAACPPVTGLTASSITASSATLNWTAAAGAVGYEWAVTTSATPPASGTATTLTTANATGLTASTAYYAHVRTNCGSSFSTWVTIPFTTISTTACPPVTGLTASSITASAATLNWTAAAGATGYEWAVTTSATPPASGTATTLTTANATGLTASTAYYAHVRTNCGSSFSAWTTIPFTTLGTTTTCPPITGLTASSITGSSAIVSWTAIASTAGYQYVIDNTVVAPAGSGTNTTATSTNPSGLTAGTTYYAHVRDSCGPGNFSPWNTIPFTTLSPTCNAPTGLAATSVTATTATIAWTPASGTVRSQYVININPSDPAVSGASTTASTATATGLTAATLYYAHVRDSCGPGAVSAWVTIPLTTGFPVYVNPVAAGELTMSLHPNPVANVLAIEFTGTRNGKGYLWLTDAWGRLLLTSEVNSDQSVIDMTALPAGIYLVRYKDDAHTQMQKVVKH